MAVRLSSILSPPLHLLLVVSILSGAVAGAKSRQPVKHTVPFFIFGDSYLDAGNNNYINTTALDRADFWPYGETHFKFPTGRFSDGRLIPDFLAEFANMSPIVPFLQPGVKDFNNGANFASSGAGALVQTFQGDVIDLTTQLRNYKKVETWFMHKLGKGEAKMALSRGVFLFSIGINDYMSPFLTNSTILNSYSNSEYVGMVIGNLTTVIKRIYKSGGRKFGFINVPNFGCLPSNRLIKSGKCLKEGLTLSRLHNEALSKLLVNLSHKLKGFKYSLYDLNSNLKLRMNHPSKYGFKEGKRACCGTGRFRGVFSCGGKRIVKKFELCKNPNEYVFWDSLHLTEKLYKQFADEMWSGSVAIGTSTHALGPYNFRTLFQSP